MLLLAAPACLSLTACAENAPSVLDPAGEGARRIAGLWWPMLWISAGVFAVVAALLVVAVVRGRAGVDTLDRSHVSWGEPFIVVAGVLLPALILTGVFVFSLREMNVLARGGDDAALTIEVEGHNWWWEVRYPNGAVTANEIHIPVGERVRIRVTSADVIHSFWVPRLQAKMDMIPGTTNELWIDADEPGIYRGQCAEFCSLQHSNMIFYVIAESTDEFEDWVANEGQPARSAPGTRNGEEVFMSSSCVGCHAIRGTQASGELGPDLTHLARRRTIGSGVLSNTRANLERFVTDPQAVKPGNAMPPTTFGEAELDDLLDYLEGLE